MSDSEETLRRVSSKISDDLTNIASHLGITKNALIKKHLHECLNMYPEKYKNPTTDPKASETMTRIAIRGLSQKTKGEIKNIATNIGLSKPNFLKYVLFQIREKYPEEKRVPYRDEL